MLETIKKLVAENLGIEEETITENASFKEDMGVDSLDLFELVMASGNSNGRSGEAEYSRRSSGLYSGAQRVIKVRKRKGEYNADGSNQIVGN